MRIRTIKPAFWKSLTLAALPIRTRLHFIGLWNYADDVGRGIDDPRLLKAELWPLDVQVGLKAVEQMQAELAAAGRIVRYEIGGRRCFQITTWTEHQKVDHPQDSLIPPPEDPEASLFDAGAFDERSRITRAVLEGKGEVREGKGRERAPARGERAFAMFWELYPRKVGKRKAQDAFDAAVRREVVTVILAATERYRDDPNREDAYTAHPTTWLNRDGWEDPPLPSHNGSGTTKQHGQRTAEQALRLAQEGR